MYTYKIYHCDSTSYHIHGSFSVHVPVQSLSKLQREYCPIEIIGMGPVGGGGAADFVSLVRKLDFNSWSFVQL